MNNGKGKLIVFSGIDGSGKSTLCKKLYEHYKDKIPCHILRGYGNRIFTNELEKISKSLNKSRAEVFSDYIRNITWFCDFSYAALDQINSLLDDGITVFVDRYSLCAQVYSLATTTQTIEKLFPLYDSIPQPDICFYLDVDVKLAVDRIIQRGKKRSYYEDYESLCKIKNTYEKIIPVQSYRIEKIDSSQPFYSVFSNTLCILDELIDKNGKT